MSSSLKPIGDYGLSIDRVEHSREVTLKVLTNPLFDTLTKEERINLSIASYYHDVGYAEELCLHPSDPHGHYIYGYLYLKSLGVGNQICRLVLHHTYAYDLERMKNKDVTLFEQNPFSPQDAKLLFILNSADITTDSKGQTVSGVERLEDIKRRYGDSHVVTRHFKKVLQSHSAEEKKYITNDGHPLSKLTN